MRRELSRRDFLKGSLATAGLTLAATVTPFGYRIVNASAASGGAGSKFAPNVWFQVTPDNLVTVAIPSAEMGQGIRTALAMIVADELEAEWKDVRVVQSPAGDPFKNPVLGGQVTVGSASVRGYYEPLRKAGAAGRAMLTAAAAQTWGVPQEECRATHGAVRHAASGRSLSYGELCARASALPVPAEPILKKESEFRYMGRPMARLDIPEKVSAKAVFGLDVDVPGMLYASLARPPAYGAKAISKNEAAALAVAGVRHVVPTPNGIAVCADSLDAAWKGRRALAVEWDQGTHPTMDTASIERQFLADLGKPGAVAAKTGDAAKAVADAPRKVDATYFVPFVAHATMEPMNATAHVRKDRCEVWVPTQNPGATRATAAKLCDLPPDKVDVHTTLLGCGFGRRSRVDFVIEAVAASKATNRPVKVVWTREEDLQYDFFRATTCQKLTAGLDGQGNVLGWNQKIACSSILRFANPAAIKNGVDLYSLWGIVDAPNSPHWNNNTAYTIPNWQVEQVLSDLPVPCSPWRSVQNAPNAFVMECFMDELARAAGKDPVEYRLPFLANNLRARRVLQAAAEKAGWGKRLPKGKGRGIAVHQCFGSYVAQVADIAVDSATGRIRVEKVVAAVDCGPVVNPGPLVAQIESGIILALSTVLKEQVEFAKGGVKSANFDDYPILRMSETPEIEVHIVESKEKIGGIGEVGVPPLAPAVANAFFAATGTRIRRLPLDPKTVLAALKAKA